MKSKKAKSLLSIMFAGLIISFIVQIAEINTTEAQNGPPVGGPPVGGPPIDVPSGGKNIIKDKPSSSEISLHQAELKGIDDQLIQNPSEDAKNQLIEQKKQIYNDIEKWFADNLDPAKEQAAREKQKLLTEAIIDKRNNFSIEEQRKLIPMTSIGYDYVSNALEVTINPAMYNEEKILVYIENIREIIGDEIDLTIAPQDYSIRDSCITRKSSCNPLEGGIEIGEAGCTIGFKATYKGDIGFVTAGHCFNSAGQSVTQPIGGAIIGTVKKETDYDGTSCDCAFVKATIPVEDGAVHGLLFDLTGTGNHFAGKHVILSGKNSGIEEGVITDTGRDVDFGGELVLDLVVTTYKSQGGDSGGTVASDIGNKLMGLHEGSNDSDFPLLFRSYYTKHENIIANFSGLTFGF